MTNLLSQNKKIAHSSQGSYTVFNFGIPAYKSQATGMVTCPMAGECGRTGGCYALQGAYVWSGVVVAYEYRLAATLLDSFNDELSAELAVKVKTADKAGKTVVVRIHDSGDFYSLEYAKKWLAIAARWPSVKFYAYTKMVVLFQGLKKNGLVLDNMTIIFSEGGKADMKINSLDRHSRVFPSLEALHAAGYADSTEDDLVAAFGPNHRVGLVYHGAKAKTWTTNAVAA